MNFINLYKQGTSKVNKNLQKAINERKGEEVKTLLTTGADINHRVNENMDTMLHIVKNAAVARDLLGYGANVNARNIFQQLPLHSVVVAGKSPEIIKTLINHGDITTINAVDSKGLTPLNYAIKNYDRNLEVVKEFVLNGANVKIESPVDNDSYDSPLEEAILREDVECVKIMIKYYLVRKFRDKKTDHDIDFCHYFGCPNHHIYLNYQKECWKEVCSMKLDMLSNSLSLFQVIMAKNEFVQPEQILYNGRYDLSQFTERCLEVITSDKYPIYSDVILQRLKYNLEKQGLVHKINTMKIYTLAGEKLIVLVADTANKLAKYLPKNDLLNLVLAFYNPKIDRNVSLCSIAFETSTEGVKKRPESSTNHGCSAKRIKV